MKIPREAIEKAIEGGYKAPFLFPDKLSPAGWDYDGEYLRIATTTTLLARLCNSEIALDPTFWQCLGKALGWQYNDEACNHSHYPCYHEKMNKAHELYHLILTGQSPDEFWREILADQQKDV